MSSDSILMPNEIFKDLQKELPVSTQVALAYSYYYYVSYLYRYCLFAITPENIMTQDKIISFLGYSPENSKIKKLFKKNGTLDKMGYTETTTDFPVFPRFDEDNLIEFTTVSELKDEYIIPVNMRNFKVKRPLRCFHRDNESRDESILNGTFYEFENTHAIRFSLFNEMMKDSALGTMGFYLYAYIKHRIDIFKDGYQASYKVLEQETGVGERTIQKYIAALEGWRYVDGKRVLSGKSYLRVEHKPYLVDAPADEREANIYRIAS